MTTSKVAPLTGALLARKGSAAPATLTPAEARPNGLEPAEAPPEAPASDQLPGFEAPPREHASEPALTADMFLAGVAKGKAIRLADTAPQARANGAAQSAVTTKPRMPSWQIAAIGAVAAVAALAGAWLVERSTAPAPAPVTAAEPDPAPAAAASDAEVAALASGLADDVSPVAEEPEAYVELVRVEPGGTTLIAGRAAPDQAVVVLDNGQPIGTATADAAGTWLYMAETPLDPGEHTIGVAIAAATTVQVTGPAVPQPAAEPVEAVPTSAPPATPAVAADGRYLVQLASVKTSAAAERAWRTLQGSLGEIVVGLEPIYDTAAVAERGSFVRVRVGPFADRATADALCDKVLARTGDCLVVQRSP